MTLFLVREVDKLKKMLLHLSAAVEENFDRAILALERRDGQLARRVLDTDTEIDLTEIDVEEECLKILALHQPVANDLRFIVSCLKINNDLERIGDLAVSIARRARPLIELPDLPIPAELRQMFEKARAMVRQSFDALVGLDAALARQVLAADDAVDELRNTLYDLIADQMGQHPDQAHGLIHLLLVTRCLERIADHATNIAEDVIYLLEGEIVRHGVRGTQDAASQLGPQS